jgi:hypothetical protein
MKPRPKGSSPLGIPGRGSIPWTWIPCQSADKARGSAGKGQKKIKVYPLRPSHAKSSHGWAVKGGQGVHDSLRESRGRSPLGSRHWTFTQYFTIRH